VAARWFHIVVQRQRIPTLAPMSLLVNMGRTDRLVRLAGAAAVTTVALSGRVSKGTAAGLGIWAAAMLFSGASGHCPLYRPFGFSTCR